MSTRILVVEDDAAIRDVIQAFLADEGYDVVVAPHGAAALDLIRQHPPALILFDVLMPVMDGWDFVRKYRELLQLDVPLICMTALNLELNPGLKLFADVVLAKPFSMLELLALVQRHLALAG